MYVRKKCRAFIFALVYEFVPSLSVSRSGGFDIRFGCERTRVQIPLRPEVVKLFLGTLYNGSVISTINSSILTSKEPINVSGWSRVKHKR